MHMSELEILSELHSASRSRAGIPPIAAGAMLSLAVVSALATVPDHRNEHPAIARVVEAVDADPTIVTTGDPDPYVRIERIQPGDTLSDLLARLDSTDSTVAPFITNSHAGAHAVRGLRAGRAVSAKLDDQGSVQALDIPLGDSEVYRLRREGGQFREVNPDDATGVVVKLSRGTITSSLFEAADRANLPDAVTVKLAELFGTEIDFNTDIRKGDEFSVMYEAVTREGAEIGVGRILSAEFINKAERHSIILFRDGDGQEGYYTPDGRNLKQAFLRSPLEFSRVTSGFALRFHPILGTWRQHKGVDFGAATGTAIKATSDGRVDFVGTKTGYGNTVILSHRNGISTLYAHMSRFPRKLKVGNHVSQGDLIGFVGSTGWATGPHLHYEFRKEGAPVDPMKIALPSADPLAARELAKFQLLAEQRLDQLAVLNYSSRLTSNTD